LLDIFNAGLSYLPFSDGSSQEQNSDSGEGYDCPEERLPANFFPEREVTDRQDNHRRQGHKHNSNTNHFALGFQSRKLGKISRQGLGNGVGTGMTHPRRLCLVRYAGKPNTKPFIAQKQKI